jgi:Tol biopolymer transport system component
MTAAGEDEKQIVRSGTAYTDYLPTWSRDGKLILFNQRSANTVSLPYIMSIPPDGSTEQGTRVSLNVLPIENVEFSPDGLWLVYEKSEPRKIFYVTITGTDHTEIKAGKGAAFDPVWRPISK